MSTMTKEKKKKKGRKSIWTDELVEQLLRLWEQGLSAKEIALKLGHGLTRNAVIGKIHRLRADGKAPLRRQGTQPQAEASRKPAPRSRQGGTADATPATAGALALKPEAEEKAAPVAEEKTAPRLVERETGLVDNILDLNDKTCRWPIGEPDEDGFCFCGREPAQGLPYCQHHASIAYQGTEQRRRATG